MNSILRLSFTASCIALLAACAGNPAPSPPPTSEAKSVPVTEINAFLQKYQGAYLHYPPAEAAAGIEGISVAILSIDRSGMVIIARIIISSGNTNMDKEAVAVWQRMMDDGVRFPLPPSLAPGYSQVTFEEPFGFCLLANTCQEKITAQMRPLLQVQDLAKQAQNEEAAGQYDQAIADDTQAIALLPTPEVFTHRGWLHYMKRDPDAAEADLNKAIELFPALDSAYNARGLIYLGRGAYEPALADFDKAIELHPGSGRAYNNRARIHMAQGDGNKALADLSKVIELSPGSPAAYNERAWAYHRTGRAGEGLADADKAIALNPRYANALDTRAHLYEDLGQRDRAIADYKAALSIKPGQMSSQDGLKRLAQ